MRYSDRFGYLQSGGTQDRCASIDVFPFGLENHMAGPSKAHEEIVDDVLKSSKMTSSLHLDQL